MKKSTFYYHCLALLALFVGYQAVSTAVAMLVAPPTDDGTLFFDPVTVGYCATIGGMAAVALLVVFGLVRRRAGLDATAVPAPLTPMTYVRSLGGALLVALGLSLLLTPLDLPDGGSEELFLAMSESPLCLLLFVIIGPFVEEVFFREGLARHLLLVGRRPWGAALLSAVIFGLIHGNWAQGINATALGFVLGLLYFRSGNIRLSLLFHILNNAIAVGFLLRPDIDDALQALPTPTLVGSGSVLLLAGSLWLWRSCRVLALCRPKLREALTGGAYRWWRR
jgi:hypothetical protein